MGPFNRNLSVLAGRDATLAERVQGCTVQPSWESFLAASGQVTARKLLEAGGRHIHSRIDPEREADQWAALLSDTTESLAVLGFGLGYPVLALRKKGYAGRLIVVEADIGLFRIAVERVELTSLFEDPGAFWIIGEEPAAAERVITALAPGSLSYRVWYPLRGLNEDYYESIRGMLEQQIFEFRLRENPPLSRGIEQLLLETIR